MRRAVKFGVVFMSCMVVSLFSVPAFAQQAPSGGGSQSNFSVTPPPIASPYFEAGKGEGKTRLTYLSIKGQGIDLKGGGFDFVGRNAFSDTWAGDVAVGFLGMTADLTGGGSLTLFNIPFSLNLELQPYKGDILSAIIFAGPTLNLGFGFMDIPNPLGGGSTTASITTVFYGAQAGLQLGIQAGDFNLSPFAMVQSQKGSSTVTVEDTSTTVDIPAVTTTSYGFDILYTPWDMTLSSVLQEAEKADQNTPGFKTRIYQISWNKKW